jgi:hypothetical protein
LRDYFVQTPAVTLSELHAPPQQSPSVTQNPPKSAHAQTFPAPQIPEQQSSATLQEGLVVAVIDEQQRAPSGSVVAWLVLPIDEGCDEQFRSATNVSGTTATTTLEKMFIGLSISRGWCRGQEA